MIRNFRRFTTVWFLLPLCASAETSRVKITAKPNQIWIERGSCGQYLNFDFVVENTTGETLNISLVEVSVFDRAEKLEVQRHLDGSGFSPNILLIPNREIASKQSVLIFNPFFAFEPDVDLAKMRFEFSIAAKDADKKYTSILEVSPAFYETKTKLVLPLKKRLLINSGYAFFAHHRRFDYLHPIVRQIGVASNFMR